MNNIHRLHLIFFLLSAINIYPLLAQTELNKIAIGKWRDHENYSFMTHVEDAGDKIFASTEYSLFSYDKTDGSIERYSKVDGLSEAGISTIAYNKKLKILLIAYMNSNIDLLIDGRVYNISGLKNKALQGDKNIYNITFDGNYAYLSCGFGILVLDLKRKEIKDTYIIGENGTSLKINNIALNDTAIIAATDKGLMYADKGNSFLAYYGNWKKHIEPVVSGSTGIFKDVLVWKNSLVVSTKIDNSQDPLYRFYYYDNETRNWITFTRDEYLRYTTARVCNNTLVVSCRYTTYFQNPDFYGWYYAIDNKKGSTVNSKDALIDSENKFWLATDYDGLFECPYYDRGNEYKIHTPTGPVTPNVSKIRNFDDKIYVAPGGRNKVYANIYIMSNVFTMEANYWTQIENRNAFGESVDILDVAIDPKNPSKLYASSWSDGLWEIENNKVVKVYDSSNSPLQKNYDNHDTYRIAGSAFDSDGNLWVANSLVSNVLCVRRTNGTWESFNTENLIGVNDDINTILIDPVYEYKWIIPKSNKIFIFDNAGNGRYINPNNGSDRESSLVNDIAFDLDGIVWIGTNKGIKLIYSIDDIFNTSSGFESTKECKNIVYTEDGLLQYLLEFENISSIVVDGANRKWVGTFGGGAFLFSPDGMEQLIHFSAENSPLPSNTIIAIEINKQTGEVFFGTDKGIVSFKSDATGFGEKNENVYVYPNPVRTGYTGPIAIKGLVRDAIVKITDVSGNLVCNIKALGGQAIWDGKNMSGRRVPSGIYLAFIADEDNTEKAVTKILFLK